MQVEVEIAGSAVAGVGKDGDAVAAADDQIELVVEVEEARADAGGGGQIGRPDVADAKALRGAEAADAVAWQDINAVISIRVGAADVGVDAVELGLFS